MIATHASRPIRSASASGPIGWAKPSLAIVSIASASATLLERVHLVDEGHQDAVRDEPGDVVGLGGRLAELLGDGRRSPPRVSSDVAAPGMIDEGHDRDRVEEVHPDHPVRTVVAAASVPIGIEEVFEESARGSRRRCGRAPLSPVHPRPRPRSSGRPRRARRGRDAASTIGLRATLLGEPGQAALHRLEPPLEVPPTESCSDTRRPGGHADPAPHLPAPTTRTCSNTRATDAFVKIAAAAAKHQTSCIACDAQHSPLRPLARDPPAKRDVARRRSSSPRRSTRRPRRDHRAATLPRSDARRGRSVGRRGHSRAGRATTCVGGADPRYKPVARGLGSGSRPVR